MNNILELTGGMPLKINDITFLQDNIIEITSALANSVSDEAYRLFGAEVTVTNSGGASPLLNISAGAIWYLDEIYMVDAVVDTALTTGTTLQDVLDTYEWDLEVTTSGSRTFYDGSTKTPRETRKAILTNTPATWTGVEADLLTYTEIIKSGSNIDIKSKAFEDSSTFTAQYTSGSNVYRDYTLESGQHIARWYTPSGVNATIVRIIPPADVFDGYELTIEIKKQPSLNRGLGFFNSNSVNLTNPNLNLQYRQLWTSADAGTTMIFTELFSHFVTFNTSIADIYEGGAYDVNGSVAGTFKIMFRWNATTSQWDETGRVKLIS